METPEDMRLPEVSYEQVTPKEAGKDKKEMSEITQLFTETTLSSTSDSPIDHKDEKRNVYVLKKSVDLSAKEFFSKNEAELVKFIQETGQKWIPTVYKNKKGEEKFWFVKVVEDKDGTQRIQRVAASEMDKLTIKNFTSDRPGDKYANNKLIGSGKENYVFAQKSYEFNTVTKQYEKVFKHIQRVKQAGLPQVASPINSMASINNTLISKNGFLPDCFPEITHSQGYEIHEDAGKELFSWILNEIYPKGSNKIRVSLNEHQNAVFEACLDSIVFLSEINYCYGDQKIENICFKINQDGNAVVKIIDYGGGALFQENGKIPDEIKGKKRGFDPKTENFITREDADAPISQKTRAVPVTAALLIDYIGIKYGKAIFRQEEGFLDPVKIGNKVDKFIITSQVTPKDQAILELAMQIIRLPAEQRPMPKQFKADYEAILARFPQ